MNNLLSSALNGFLFGDKVNVYIIVNGNPLSVLAGVELVSVDIIDEIGIYADQLTLTFTAGFLRPSGGDKIQIFVNMINYGLYLVQETIKTEKLLTVKAISANFKDSLKEKKSRSFEKMSLCKLVKKIAGEHQLVTKCTIEAEIKHLSQDNESDISLLARLAKEHNATFNIKQNTIIFLKEDEQDLPLFTIFEKEVESYEIRETTKNQYSSCKAIWRDTKQGKDMSVIVGEGKPQFVLKGNFKDKAEAKTKAEAKLKAIKQEAKTGRITIYGQEIRAGGKLLLVGFFLDDGIHKIKKVTHKIGESGYRITVDFRVIV